MSSTTSSISATIIIFVVFIFLYFTAHLTVSIEKIKKNWPKYRCNPSVMPVSAVFGHNTYDNFVYCINNIANINSEKNNASMKNDINILAKASQNTTKSTYNIRDQLKLLRKSVGGNTGGLANMFVGLEVELAKMMSTMKDVIGKFTAIITTVMYTVDGSVSLVLSTWNGPPGGSIRFLCFHPDTLIKLKNNKFVKIKDINTNDILKTGNKVYGTMKLSNINENGNQVEDMYTVKNGENNEEIVVSGSHLIYDPEVNGFVKVKDLKGKYPSIKTDIKCPDLYCLITSDHTIPIGKWIFHDWEDNNGSASKNLI